jgi:hypothetical protein
VVADATGHQQGLISLHALNRTTASLNWR